jgi:hypothetical protein
MIANRTSKGFGGAGPGHLVSSEPERELRAVIFRYTLFVNQNILSGGDAFGYGPKKIQSFNGFTTHWTGVVFVSPTQIVFD